MKLGGINTTKIHVAKDSQRIKKKKRNILILAMLILGSIRQKSREQSDLFQAKDRKSAFKVRRCQ